MAKKIIGIVHTSDSFQLSSGQNGDHVAEFDANGTPRYATLEAAQAAAKALAKKRHCGVDLEPEY